MSEHLKGPWFAVLADEHGFVYESAEDARENAEDPENDEFEISIVRGSAAPKVVMGDRARLPGTLYSGDKVFELGYLYLDGDGDETVGVVARFAQAQAMAAGLNAAGAES